MQMPPLDALFFAALMRWGMLLIVVVAILWGMYELFRRWSMVESIFGYGATKSVGKGG